MIRVRVIIVVGSMIIPVVNSAWIVNHFGMNPRKGGIPLSDRKLRIKKNLVIVVEFID